MNLHSVCMWIDLEYEPSRRLQAMVGTAYAKVAEHAVSTTLQTVKISPALVALYCLCVPARGLAAPCH